MISEPDTERCASEEAESQRGWTQGSVLIRMLGSKGRWIGDPTSIGERTSTWTVRGSHSPRCVLKNLRGSQERKAQR